MDIRGEEMKKVFLVMLFLGSIILMNGIEEEVIYWKYGAITNYREVVMILSGTCSTYTRVDMVYKLYDKEGNFIIEITVTDGFCLILSKAPIE